MTINWVLKGKLSNDVTYVDYLWWLCMLRWDYDLVQCDYCYVICMFVRITLIMMCWDVLMRTWGGTLGWDILINNHE
jgi:hypothetical protein